MEYRSKRERGTGNCLGQGSRCLKCPLRLMERPPLEVRLGPPDRPSAIYLRDGLRLEEELGRGAMGTVFCAMDLERDELVAVKFLLPKLQENPKMVARFREEASTTAAIDHRNVVKIYSTGVFGSSDYFVEEYIDGFMIYDIIRVMRARGIMLPVYCTLRILEQACAGLGAIHDAGIIHRDLTPRNIMVEPDTGRVVIMDFGIGKRPSSEDSSEKLNPGGTPAYMAPEYLDGSYRELPRAHLVDIYSLGVTAFETLTGERLFEGRSLKGVLYQHYIKDRPPPSAIRSDIPPEVDEVILKCLEKNPTDRFGSSAELAAAVRGLIRIVDKRDTDRDVLRSSAVLAPMSNGKNGKLKPRSAEERAADLLSNVIVSSADLEPVAVFQEGAQRFWPTCQVRASRSIVKALELARRDKARLLVTALEDPERDGFEVSSIMKRDDYLKDVLLIVYTPRPPQTLEHYLQHKWIDGVLTLPFTADDVERVLTELIGDLSLLTQ